MSTGDEADVLAAFNGLFEALVDRRDPDAGTRLFLDRADAVMWGSEEHERALGRAEIAALHRAIVSAEVSVHWHHCHAYVEHDVAWVNADGEVTVYRAESAPRTTPYRLTAVLLRREGRWRWHTFHGSEPNPSSA